LNSPCQDLQNDTPHHGFLKNLPISRAPRAATMRPRAPANELDLTFDLIYRLVKTDFKKVNPFKS